MGSFKKLIKAIDSLLKLKKRIHTFAHVSHEFQVRDLTQDASTINSATAFFPCPLWPLNCVSYFLIVFLSWCWFPGWVGLGPVSHGRQRRCGEGVGPGLLLCLPPDQQSSHLVSCGRGLSSCASSDCLLLNGDNSHIISFQHLQYFFQMLRTWSNKKSSSTVQ